jgi:phage baseplate assembly protein W
MPSFQTFKDISVTFNEHPNTKDLLVVKEQQAVKIALQNLVMTAKGERPFRSDLGSNIRRSLFDLLDFGTAGIIRSELFLLIERYEPRVRVIDITVNPEFDQNAYSVFIEFEIIGRENPNTPLSTEFILTRTR